MHNRLGRNLKEKQYADAAEILFMKYQIKYQREIAVPINFEGINIEGNRIDFLIEDKIPVDFKAKKYITKEDYKEMQRYLKATNRKLGLVVNFREKRLKLKRIINSKGEE